MASLRQWVSHSFGIYVTSAVVFTLKLGPDLYTDKIWYKKEHQCLIGIIQLVVHIVRRNFMILFAVVCIYDPHRSYSIQNTDLSITLLTVYCFRFASSPRLMTPVLNPHLECAGNYISVHTRTRVFIVRAFGILKIRFRCLHSSGSEFLHIYYDNKPILKIRNFILQNAAYNNVLQSAQY